MGNGSDNCDDPDESPGIENYDVLSTIGQGKYGTCLLVRHRRLRKVYALKRIPYDHTKEKKRQETLIEAQVLARLSHPNIIKYKESFLYEDALCIVTDYCEEGDLSSRIEDVHTRGERFAEEQILEWCVQIMLGLHYIHSKKVIHRDLKSQNVFLARGGKIKLGDFSISKVLERTEDFATTLTGTPYYMAPEICSNRPYSYQSDVWSLGCIVYELCTLSHAFYANSLLGLMQKILHGAIREIPSVYSRELRTMVYSMLNKNPALRPTVTDLLHSPFIRSVRAALPPGRGGFIPGELEQEPPRRPGNLGSTPSHSPASSVGHSGSQSSIPRPAPYTGSNLSGAAKAGNPTMSPLPARMQDASATSEDGSLVHERHHLQMSADSLEDAADQGRGAVPRKEDALSVVAHKPASLNGATPETGRVRLLSGGSAISEKAPSVSSSVVSGGTKLGLGGMGAHAAATGTNHVENWLHSHVEPCNDAKQAAPPAPTLTPGHNQWKSATPLYVDRGADNEDAHKSEDTLFLTGMSDVNAATLAEASSMQEFHLKSTISQSSCVGVQVVVHIASGETIVLKRRARREDADWHTQHRQVAAGTVERLVLENFVHPRVVRYRTSFRQGGAMCIGMELMSSESLADMVAHGKMSEENSRLVFWQVLLALKALHEHGIVHNLVKLEHFLPKIKGDLSSVKMIGFSAAHVSGLHGPTQSIADHTHFPYMAPELLKVVMEDTQRPGGPQPVNPTSKMDMWSAGVCLYTMLCGYNPFAVGGSLLVLEGIQKGQFSFEEGAVSQPAQDLICRLMTLNPVNRLSAHEAMQHPWLQENLTKSMRFIAGESERSAKQKQKLRAVVINRQFVRIVHSITAICAMQRWARFGRGAKQISDVQAMQSDRVSQAAQVAQMTSQISKASTKETPSTTEKVKKKGFSGFFKMFKR